MALLGSSSCTSGGAAAGSGTPTRLLLRDFRAGVDLELVNDAFDDRLRYYSQLRDEDQTGRKFQTDEVIDAMLELLDKQGWDRYAQPGPAPRDGASVISSAFELERDGNTTHWKIGNGSEAGMRRSFIEAKKAFLALYAQTAGFQAVKNTNFEVEFKQPQLGSPNR